MAGDVPAVSVIFAVAVCVGFAILATVSTIVCRLEIVTGAVYTPFVMLPTGGTSVHVTVEADAGAPALVTLNWVDWPPVREIEEGVSAMPTVGTRLIVALLVLVESAALVAVTVTIC